VNQGRIDITCKYVFAGSRSGVSTVHIFPWSLRMLFVWNMGLAHRIHNLHHEREKREFASQMSGVDTTDDEDGNRSTPSTDLRSMNLNINYDTEVHPLQQLKRITQDGTPWSTSARMRSGLRRGSKV